MPRLKESHLEKAARNCMANTRVGCDGFHPEVPLELTRETRGEVVELLEKVEAVWEMAATSLHNDVLLDSEKRHVRASHRASACDDSLVGSLASARGLDMATQVSD